MFEQKSNDRITKMREEMNNILETLLMEIRTNRAASTITNPKSETLETQKSQPLGSKTDKSIGVRASNIENADSEDEDCPLSPSELEDFRHPTKSLY